MLKDLLICFFASCNILIFSFIGLNYEAFAKVREFKATGVVAAEPTVEELVMQWQESALARVPSFSPGNRAVSTDSALATSSPRFLMIPKLNLISPVSEQHEQGLETALTHLKQGVIAVNDFVPPQENGQTVILGHSSDYPWRNNPYSTIFTLLPQLKPGDEIKILENNRNFVYQVKRTMITDDKLSGVLTDLSSTNELILSTCYPIGFFSQRFNVVATPTSDI